MRVLLDTHALLWALSNEDRLSPRAKDVITDLGNDVLVSSVSAWEIAIKRAIGRLEAPEDFRDALDDAGFVPRVLTFSDCDCLATLPVHHRDPFDRMLVAQATVDGIPLVTKDTQIQRYSVQTIW